MPANKKTNSSELLNTKNKLIDVKPLTIYNSLSPYIDADKKVNVISSILCGKDDVTPVIDKKDNYPIDQKALVKSSILLGMRPKDDPSDSDQRMSLEKWLILKPENCDSSINEQEKEIISLGKVINGNTKPLNGMKNKKKNGKKLLTKKEGFQVYNHWESNINL